MIVEIQPDGSHLDITARVAEEKRQIREGLRRKGMTFAAFARACHTSPSNISAQLSEHSEWPVRGYIYKVAVDLGLVA